MKILTTVAEMRSASRLAQRQGQSIGLVPTMGALHEGHLSLVRAAKSHAQAVAVSIFVNPTQFGPNEDFAHYPRSFDRDCQLLRQQEVDLVFAPSIEEMYPEGAASFVTVEGMSEKLCGRSRPGHFRGVTTVVAKLFHIVEPDLAFFGQKDAAQVAILQRMLRDLHMPVRIVVCPIVRDPDGLALSSRNAYLDREQRNSALLLSHALRQLEQVFDQGERSAARLIEAGRKVIAEDASLRLDYLEIVNPETLEPVEVISSKALVAVAAFLGKTRLIDNVILRGDD